MTKVFLTGHRGFIGSYLIKDLKKNYNIVTFKRRINKENYEDLINFQSASVVVHAAASTGILKSWDSPDKLIENNTFLTKSIIDYCLKNNSFLIYISSYLYGETKNFPTPETEELKTNNPYAESKKISEDMCFFHQKKSGLNVTVVRPFNIYGYFENNNQLIMSVIKQIVQKKEILVSGLNPKRDLLYIKDFCELLRKIIKNELANEIFNAGSGNNYSVKEVIDTIQKLYSSNLPINCLNEERENEIFETKADISKAKKLLNWEPIWSLDKGILDTINHIKL